jgi:CRISPR-associated protein Csb3
MNTTSEAAIHVSVDPTNPGQFFACCGLLELADRLWEGAEGWFEAGRFCFKTNGTGASLPTLLNAVKEICLAEDESGTEAEENEEDAESDGKERTSSSLRIVSPVALFLDWWVDKSVKTWAGSMNERKIFLAMCGAIDPQNTDPFNQCEVVLDSIAPAEPASGNQKKQLKKREPFYFDARRGASALSIDIGFSADSLKVSTVAYPVVEAMAFIGLQRCRPKPTDAPRVFDYFVWSTPLPVSVAPLAVCGLIGKGDGFRFENAFRTDQRKHKAFNPATPIQRR